MKNLCHALDCLRCIHWHLISPKPKRSCVIRAIANLALVPVLLVERSTEYNAMADILNPLNPPAISFGNFSASANNLILDQVITQQNNASILADAAYDAEINKYNSTLNQHTKVKAGIEDALKNVDSAIETIESVEKMFVQLKIFAEKAQSSGDTAYYRDEFNKKIEEINRMIDRGARENNLIGQVTPTIWEANSIEYQSTLYGGYKEVEGTYVGSNFTITDTDGDIWVSSASSSSFKEYTAYPGGEDEETGVSTSLRNGVQLDSYDEATGDITITLNPETDPQVVSGTIDRQGSKLMGAWFYDNLSTSAGYDRLSEDIAHARYVMSLAKGQLSVGKAQITSDLARIDASMQDVTAKQVAVMEEQAIDQQTRQVENQNEYIRISNNLLAMQQSADVTSVLKNAAGSGYSSLFSFI
jgi:hypothetical protein